MRKIVIVCLLTLLAFSSCYRLPDLHLYDSENPAIDIAMAEVQLDLYWTYYDNDWRSEWYYGNHGLPGGWDDEDRRIFGELEYVEPTHFFIYRYFTGDVGNGKRLSKKEAYIQGRTFRAPYDWGYWDILAWNDVNTLDGVQSIRFDEKSSFDEDIIAYTNSTMYRTRYHAPRYENSFYEPEQLFSVCEKGIEINKNLDGFVFEEESNMWVKRLKMYLEPITYIYLPQIILRHNYDATRMVDRITSVPGSANLSGMARSTTLNTGISGTDAIAVNFGVRMKQEMEYKDGELVDIVGGRLMTFGICGQNANRVSRADENKDSERHYIDVQMQFYNGMDSTFVFDVTNQVRERYKGGVITVELDMDTVPIPKRPGGSGFDAVVKEYDQESHEIEL